MDNIDNVITDEADTWHSSPGDTAVPSSGGSAHSDTVHHSDHHDDHDDHEERHDDDEESSGDGDGTTDDDEGGDDDDGWGWGRQLETGYNYVLLFDMHVDLYSNSDFFCVGTEIYFSKDDFLLGIQNG